MFSTPALSRIVSATENTDEIIAYKNTHLSVKTKNMMMHGLRARGLEPKRLRLVCRRAGDAPSLLLLEARRGGRPGLDIAAPLCLEDGTGRPTAELDNAYFRTKETNA